MINIPWHPSRQELRIFGLLQIVFFAVVTSLAVANGKMARETAWLIVGVSAAIGGIGWFWLAGLRYFFLAWMIAVFPIGWIISHVILAVIFFLVFTPVGLMMRLCGKDPLKRKFDPQAETYWIRRSPESATERYFRQY